MKNLEKKIDLLVSLALASDDESRNRFKESLEDLVKVNEPSPSAPATIEDEVYDTLQELGIPSSLSGHSRIAYAICQVLEEPWLVDAITKCLYPQVAKAFNTTPSRVERAIRHAIEVAWDRCDSNVIKEYFGNTISLNTGKPTNSEFISQVALHIRRKRACR